METSFQSEGDGPRSFPVKSRVSQECILATTLFNFHRLGKGETVMLGTSDPASAAVGILLELRLIARLRDLTGTTSVSKDRILRETGISQVTCMIQ